MRSMCRVLFKKNVFSVRQKQSICMSGSRKLFRNKFHVVDPATAKVRRPYVSSWNRGTTSRWRLAERRCCLSATWATVCTQLRPSPQACMLLDLPHRANVAQSVKKQVCQAAVVPLRAAHNSRCSVHDPLQLVGNRLCCSGQQQIAIVDPGRNDGVNQYGCRFVVEWSANSSKLSKPVEGRWTDDGHNVINPCAITSVYCSSHSGVGTGGSGGSMNLGPQAPGTPE